MGDQKAPVFEKKPSIRQEEDEDRLFFECVIVANPTPSISWFRDDKPVESKDRFHVTCDRKGNAYHCALVIDDVDEEDGGKYKVSAKNSLGESSATISLNFDSDDEEEETGKPTFTGKPLIKQSPDFKSIIFECSLSADPTPTLQWFHNGRPINDGGRYKYSLLPVTSGYTVKLDIAEVGSEDGGEYKVTAKNSVGEGSATINLNFAADASKKIPGGKAPRFPKKPAIKHEGESLILEVQLEAHPFPKICWFLGTTEVREGPRHKITKKDLSKDTYLLLLEILDPSPEDGGTYRCNAVNELGESNANIVLNLQGAEEGPTFTQKPKIIPKENGKLILMECHVKSKSALLVTWYQGSKVIQESGRFKSSVVELRGNEYKVALEIRDPSAKDGSGYKCNIRNDEGEINANLNLNIEGDRIEGDAPTFVEKPKIISEDEGKRIIMECKVKASPKPTIAWLLDSVAIKETNRIVQTVKQEKDVYTIRLELKSPELTDAGLYKCNVKNVAGESNANLTLNIELAPVIREKPKVIRREKEEKVVIECHVRSNAQPECIWFKENSMVKADAKHKVEIKKVDKGEYSVKLEIDKPSPADKGLYKLQAKNEKGVIASEAVKVSLEDESKEDVKKKNDTKIEDKKDTKRMEEKKDFNKVEEKKEIKKVEDKKDTKRVEEKKDLNKVEEKKEIKKVEDKKDTKKMEEKKDFNKVEEKKEIKKIEDKKDTKRMEEKKDFNKVEEKKEFKKVEEKKDVKNVEEKKDSKTVEEKREEKKIAEKKNEQIEERKKIQKKEEQKEISKSQEKKAEQKDVKEILDKKDEQSYSKSVFDKKEKKDTHATQEREEEKKLLEKKNEQKDFAIEKRTETKEERKDSIKSNIDKKGELSKKQTSKMDTQDISKKQTEPKTDVKTNEMDTKTFSDIKKTVKMDERETSKLGQTKVEPKVSEDPKTSLGSKNLSKVDASKKDETSKTVDKKYAGRPEPAVEPPKQLGNIVLKKRTGDPPKFVKTFNSVVVDIGKSAEFVCEIESKERATVTWYKNKKVIDEPMSYKISFDGKKASIVMTRTNPDFNGVYTCEVSNTFGKVEAEATLFVKEPGMKMPELKDLEVRKAVPLEPMSVVEYDEPEKKKAEVKKKVVKKKKSSRQSCPR